MSYSSVARYLSFCIVVAGLLVVPDAVSAQEIINNLNAGLPAVNMVDQGNGSTTYSLSLQILALMAGLTILPSLVLGMTSFTRIIIVLSILRQAMGTQQTPPNQVLIAIALFLSLFIMTPTLTSVYEDAVTPYMEGTMPAAQALDTGSSVMKSFMVRNTREKDLTMFADMAGDTTYETPTNVPLTVLLPAFITSELKTAFQIGFLLFLPFLVIDMVIASILMSLGMMMLSPMLVALPFKLLLFVLVDGWAMTVGSLVATYAAN
jgi:flagellar biosynthetic protein FliP